MKNSMIKALENRIQQMKDFDVTFVAGLNNLQEKVNALSVSYKPEELSDDKSVRSHIRKRTQSINNVLARCSRDLEKAIKAIQEATEQETPAQETPEETPAQETPAQEGNE